VGPNLDHKFGKNVLKVFQSSVRINVGPNLGATPFYSLFKLLFQSSVRINVGPNIGEGRISSGRDGCFNPP